MFAGIGFATESVLRRKNVDHVKAAGQHKVECMFVADHAGVVGEQGNTFALEVRNIAVGACRADNHIGRLRAQASQEQGRKD